MPRIVTPYVFDPVAMTITFTSMSNADVLSIVSIINTNSAADTIYDVRVPFKRGSVTNNVIQLCVSTIGMSASDNLLINTDSQTVKHASTYSCSVNVAPAASATDIVTISGSANKTIEIKKIEINGIQTTGGVVEFLLIKRSAANTAGTSTTGTVVPNDSNDIAGTAVVKNYTANPTGLGTAVGTVKRLKGVVPATTAASIDVYTLNFGERNKALILRGVAQSLAINLNGVTVTGGNINVNIEWTEE